MYILSWHDLQRNVYISKSSTIAGSHFENFVSDKRIFGAKTVNCVYLSTVTVIWEEFDEPDPEIDELLQYLSELIGQQQARLIGNFCSQSGKPFTKRIQHEKINSSKELFSNTLFTDDIQ